MPKFYTLLLCLFIAISPAKAQKPVTAPGYPVIINKDTLFKFYTAQGLFTPTERAQVVTKRINELIHRLDFVADSLKLTHDSALSVITYKSEIVFAVNEQDSKFSELSRKALADNYYTLLKQRLKTATETYNLKELAIQVGEALLVFALLIFLIWLVNRAFAWIGSRIVNSWTRRVDALAQKGAPANYVNRLLPFINTLLRVVKFVVIILLVYLSLPVLFYIFPWTKPIATQLLGYVINPLKSIVLAFLRYIPNLLTVMVIYVVTRYIVKFIGFIATEIKNGAFTIRNFYSDWAIPTYNIIRVILYAFMFVVIFPYLPGSQTKVFQGVTVFLGVLFSFGSSSAISNMVAGIVLTYMRPFKVGDRVRLGEVTGDVIEKNLLITRVRTIKNEDITIPNSSILSGHAVNYTSSAKTLGLILHSTITIGYDMPWQTIHRLLIDAALATEGIQPEPKPFVLQTELNDFNVGYQINAYTDMPKKMALIYSELHKNIQDKFNEAGVEIMSPHFTSIRDGNGIQIPDDYKAEGYKSPGFNVNKAE
jgi:small-conductance mechanosensitive channel